MSLINDVELAPEFVEVYEQERDRSRALELVLELAHAAKLTKREREVLALRLVGLTFPAIAEVLGISRARPHQLEASAIKRMRGVVHAQALREVHSPRPKPRQSRSPAGAAH